MWERSKPVYEKLARALAPVTGLSLRTFDVNANKLVPEDFGAAKDSFVDNKPWLVLFAPGKHAGMDFDSLPNHGAGWRKAEQHTAVTPTHTLIV